MLLSSEEQKAEDSVVGGYVDLCLCYATQPHGGRHDQDVFYFSSSFVAGSLSNHLAATIDLLSKMFSSDINQKRKCYFPSFSHFLPETDLNFIF